MQQPDPENPSQEITRKTREAQNNWNMLLSKINAKMLMICDNDITIDQIADVQNHKTTFGGKEALESFDVK